jgi:hypothetical protein
MLSEQRTSVRRVIRRRSADKLNVSEMIMGVFALLISGAAGAYLTVGIQQLIKAYDYVAIENDPLAIHNKSVFLLSLIALAIGWFGGRSGSWILSQQRVITSAIGLGLLGGYTVYQAGATMMTGSNYYLFVLIVLTVTTFASFFTAGGQHQMRLVFKQHPGRAQD